MRRGTERDYIFVEPKQYLQRGTASLIREQIRQRFGRFRGAIERQRRPRLWYRPAPQGVPMDTKQQQTALIAYLESALELAEKLYEPTAAYLIERALDEARSRAVGSVGPDESQQFN